MTSARSADLVSRPRGVARTPALVISGTTVGLGVTRGLGVMGVPVDVLRYDDHDIGHVSKYVRRTVRVPHPELDEERFVDLLVDLASGLGRALLVPASDAAMASVSRHRERLQEHYLVAATGWEITRRFIEKERTYALADRVGVPAPRTLVPRSTEDVQRHSEELGFPLLVKPSQGHRFIARFGRKMVEVQELRQALEWYRRSAAAGLEVVLQEIIPGPAGEGANYNAYFWEGQPLAEFTARKVRNSPPRYGSPRVTISAHIPEVIEPGRQILRAMGFSGYACTEFKRDARDGVWKLMEVNGRHNLSSMLAIRCGVNFPWIQYRHLVEGEPPQIGPIEYGVYWIDLIRDLGCDVRYLGREGFSLTEYLRPYLRPHVFAIWDPSDPKPLGVQVVGLTRSAVSAAARRATRSPGRAPRPQGAVRLRPNRGR